MSQVEVLDVLGFEGIKVVQKWRKSMQKMIKGLGICKLIVQAVSREFGFNPVFGARMRDGEVVGHWWNELPDGRILDCSSDQFGEDGITISPKGDERYGPKS